MQNIGPIQCVLVMCILISHDYHGAFAIERRFADKSLPAMAASIPADSSPMVRAVLLECPKETKKKLRPDVDVRKQVQCEEQLMVNIRVNPSFHIEKVEKFLILDEVYDPRKRTKAKIMSPYLIEISRGEPVMMYPLEFTKAVKCDNCEGSMGNETKFSMNKPEKTQKCDTPEQKKCDSVNAEPMQESMNRVIQKISSAISPATKIKECDSKNSQSEDSDEDMGKVTPERYSKVVAPVETESEAKKTCPKTDHVEKRNMQRKGKTSNAEDSNQDENESRLETKVVNLENSVRESSPKTRSSKMPGRGSREDQAEVGVDKNLMKKLDNCGKMAQLGLVKATVRRTSHAKECSRQPAVIERDQDVAIDSENAEIEDKVAESNSHGQQESNFIDGSQRFSQPVKQTSDWNENNLEYDDSEENVENDDTPSALITQQEDNDAPDGFDTQNDADVLDDDVGRENYMLRKGDKRRRLFPKRQHNDNAHYKSKEEVDAESYFNFDSPADVYQKKQNPSVGFKSCECKSGVESAKTSNVRDTRFLDFDYSDSDIDVDDDTDDFEDTSATIDMCMEKGSPVKLNMNDDSELLGEITNEEQFDVPDQKQDKIKDKQKQNLEFNSNLNNDKSFGSSMTSKSDNKVSNALKELTELKKPNREVQTKQKLWVEKPFSNEDSNSQDDNNEEAKDDDPTSAEFNGKKFHWGNNRNNNGGSKSKHVNFQHGHRTESERNRNQGLTDRNKFKNQYYSEEFRPMTSPGKPQLYSRNYYGNNRKTMYNSRPNYDMDSNMNRYRNGNDKYESSYSNYGSGPRYKPSYENPYYEPRFKPMRQKEVNEIDNKYDRVDYESDSSNLKYHDGNEVNGQKSDPGYGYNMGMTVFDQKTGDHDKKFRYGNRYGSSLSSNKSPYYKNKFDSSFNKHSNNVLESPISILQPKDKTSSEKSSDMSDSKNENYKGANYLILPTYGSDTSKAEKELNPADSQLETLSLLNNLNNFYTEKPPKYVSPLHKKYYSAYLQPPRSSSQELIEEPSQFLPKLPPYARVIDDPNLNVHDKLHMIEAVDPQNSQSERKLNQLTQEVDKFILRPNPFPLPFNIVTSTNKLVDTNKKKRSFLFYDDLELRETDDNERENDANTENNININVNDADDNSEGANGNRQSLQIQKRSPSSSFTGHNDETQPCSSCGGKGKKPTGKTEPAVHSRDTPCACGPKLEPTCACLADEDSANAGSASVAAGTGATRSDASEDDGNANGKSTRSVFETWYSVFNMSAPLPFLTTKMQIFRKRHNTWWKIAPSITLNSLSGIFANANLSILFSSHVDIFQLEKSLRLQNHQLIIPKDNEPVLSRKFPAKAYRTVNYNTATALEEYLKKLNSNPNVMYTINNNKVARNAQNDSIDNTKVFPNLYATDFENTLCWGIQQLKGDKASQKLRRGHDLVWGDVNAAANKRSCPGLDPIGDLGYFPASMNLLEKCPNDKNHLCLNLLDDKVPAYSFKLKMPFRENSVIGHNELKVKISRVITDATTKDALQVAIEVINMNPEAKEFSITIANCPNSCASPAQMTVRRLLMPHIGETITFLLPLVIESSQRHIRFHCDVVVAVNLPISKEKTPNLTAAQMKKAGLNLDVLTIKKKTVAIRKMTIESDNRCFCVWECECHCMPALETYVDFKICQTLSYQEEKNAGLLLHCNSGDQGENLCTDDDEVGVLSPDDDRDFYEFLQNAIILLVIMLLLGLLKATIGRFVTKVDKWGYSYVQPGRGYCNSSRLRRFFVNCFFFVVFPFVFWCKCFTPSEDDLLVASTEWQCSDEKASNRNKRHDKDDDRCDRCSNCSCFKSRDRLQGGQEFTRMDKRLNDLTMAFNEHIFDDEDEDDEEVNTKFILQALVESRESLKKLASLQEHSTPSIALEEEATNPKLKEAANLVQNLKTAQIVYRVFDKPVGNVRNIPMGIRYSIQGYFLPSLGTGFEFVNYNPLAQYRCMSANGKNIEILRPPVILYPKEFSRVYANKMEVLNAGDLFVQPPLNAPCINITTMSAVATSVAKLASESNFCINSTKLQPTKSSRGTEKRPSPPPEYEWQDFDLPIEDEEDPNDDHANEQSRSTELGAFPYSMEYDDQLEEESEEIVTDSVSLDYPNYKCDTILE